MEKKEIILGRNPVLEYLRSPRPGGRARLYVARKAHGKIVDVIIQEARGRGIPVEYRDRDFFREYPEDNHQEYSSLPHTPKTPPMRRASCGMW